MWTDPHIELITESLLAPHVIRPPPRGIGRLLSHTCQGHALGVCQIWTVRGLWVQVGVIRVHLQSYLVRGFGPTFPAVSTRPRLPCWCYCSWWCCRRGSRISRQYSHASGVRCIVGRCSIPYTHQLCYQSSGRHVSVSPSTAPIPASNIRYSRWLSPGLCQSSNFGMLWWDPTLQGQLRSEMTVFRILQWTPQNPLHSRLWHLKFLVVEFASIV